MHDKRFPASQAERLDNPERHLWLPPADVIDALGVQPGQVIADVGAGTGYFTLPLSSAVGADGKVYAIDGQQEMLAWIERKLHMTEFQNIEMLHAEASNTSLPAARCDFFFLANLWHEIEDRAAVLAEALRVLKQGGQIAILDWRTDVERIGGPPLEHRISSADALKEMQFAGFEEPVITEVGMYSWLVQGEKV